MNKVEFERKLETRMDLELLNEPKMEGTNLTLNMTMNEIANYNLSPEYLN
jgi:hypothetical protein